MAEVVVERQVIGNDDFTLEIVGDGTWSGERRADFIGPIVGYNWSAKTAAIRDQITIDWKEDRGSRALTSRSGLSGSVRFPVSGRVTFNRMGLVITRTHSR